MAVNCDQLNEEDISKILEEILFAFPVSEIHFHIPKWVEMLSKEHEIKQDILMWIQNLMGQMNVLRDAKRQLVCLDSTYIQEWKITEIAPDTGYVVIRIEVPDKYYYEMLSNLSGVEIIGQYELVSVMKSLAETICEYGEIKDAFAAGRMIGYGIVSPKKEDITLDAPEIIKQGNK